MKDKSLLLSLVGEMPLFKIIDFLIDNKGVDFSKKNIAEGAGIARASLFNYWPKLERRRLVKVTRSFGKTKLYTLNTTNPLVQKILDLEASLIRQAMIDAKKEEVLIEA